MSARTTYPYLELILLAGVLHDGIFGEAYVIHGIHAKQHVVLEIFPRIFHGEKHFLLVERDSIVVDIGADGVVLGDRD